MDPTVSLEDKFNAAVKAIQRLPNDGTFQPSNEMKLTFYGLYKQATVGPCNESRPSMFNYINRAKWDAWDKCRSMSKEAAMAAYIDEIRKILETMPQTNEVLEFTKLIGPFYEFVDDHNEENGTISTLKKKSPHTNSNKKKQNHHRKLVNGTHNSNEYPVNHMNGPSRTQISAGNGPGPSSSPSSSSTPISASSSDAEEFYDDPSDRLIINNNNLSNDDITMNNNNNHNNESLPVSNIPIEQISTNTMKHNPHVYGGQDETNLPVHRSHRGGSHANEYRGSPTHSSNRHHNPSNNGRYSFSSVASGSGGNGRIPNNNYNVETQRAILTALTKLQRDVNNILERLNRLETSSHFLQQRETSSRHNSGSKSLTRWLPLAGLRRRAVAFILLWPFFVFLLIRLFLRARIIIRFRQPRL